LAGSASFNIIERDSLLAITAHAENPEVKPAAMKARHGQRAWRRALLCLMAVAALMLAAVETGFAGNPWANSHNAWGSNPNAWGSTPNAWGSNPNAWGSNPNAWGSNSNAWGRGPSSKVGKGEPSNDTGYVVVPSDAIKDNPSMVPRGGEYVDTGAIPDGLTGPRRPPRRAARRVTGVPPAGEKRLIRDEVVVELANSVSAKAIEALQLRHRLTSVQSQPLPLLGTTIFRWRISDRRPVAAVVRALEADAVVASAQPNYLFTLQQDAAKPASDSAAPEGDPAQYELAKLRLPQAHTLAKGDNILVAVIDSGVDVSHPELTGAIAQSFDATDTPAAPDKHGTAMAGLIAGHGRLMGAAPGARILAIQAFAPPGAGAQGTTFNILKGLDWAVANGARVIAMGFAGPDDPALHRALAAAHKKNIVLVAPAGNAGPKSPPLYPAADENVIAVSATDADDKLFPQSNRGRYIAMAAPGVRIAVAMPDAGYGQASGTSYAAAEVSGIVALMLQHKGDLTPDKVRGILMQTARDLGPKGRDSMFGAGLADAYAAILAEDAPVAAARTRHVKRAIAGRR
jgi:subtilisin family serine protease